MLAEGKYNGNLTYIIIRKEDKWKVVSLLMQIVLYRFGSRK